MKIKLIDLLQMKAKNEEMPKEIIYNGHKWLLDNDEYSYYNDEIEKCLFEDYIDKKWYITEVLNDEVEIVEEPKKIEKICRCDDIDMTHSGEMFKPNKNEEILRIKLNEVIDKINEMSDK